MKDCLFCQIVAGTIPAAIVYENESVLAFEDVRPQAPVHVLVIPKLHVASVQDVGATDAALLGDLLVCCTKIAEHKGISDAGYRLVTNTGRNAGQTVFHLHFHVLGGRAMTWPPG
ncbi:MAG TPA: histidine triad nucleotide-binding protein [Nitrospiraceae bacterium]|nr:histidine triad nucleotide-binding protein [Nitrospiraceae bacterium]